MQLETAINDDNKILTVLLIYQKEKTVRNKFSRV